MHVLTRCQTHNVAERRLVNNQYLAETMQHLAENNAFRLRRGFDRHSLPRPGFVRQIRTLILDWDTYADPELMDINRMFPRLRRLELNINSSQMLLFQTDEHPNEAKVRRTPLADALSKVCGLWAFDLHDMAGHGAGYLGRSPEGRDSRRRRLGILRRVLRQMVTRSVGEGEEMVRD